MRSLLLSFLAVLAVSTGFSKEYKITPQCEKALEHILSFRLNSAKKIIAAERSSNPDNMYLHYLDNWVDMMELVAYEDEDHYEEFLDNFDDRLDLMEEDRPTSKYYYAIRAEMYAQAAAMNVMNDDTYSGFMKVYKANKLINKSVEKHPDLWLNNKLVGMFNVVYGDIPPVIAWVASIVGMEGDTDKGFRLLKKYSSSVRGKRGLYPESVLFLVVAHKVTKDDEGGYVMMKKYFNPEMSTLLDAYFYGNLMYRSGQNEDAIVMLKSLKERYKPEVPFYNIDYMLGRTMMAKLSTDANVYMERYIRNSKSKNYKLEIYGKLMDYYFIRGNRIKYKYYKDLILDKGKAFTDRDREAIVNAERDYVPNVKLLKVRYLLKGHYWDRAKKILDQINVNTLGRDAFKAEYYLQLGKVYLGRGMTNEAKASFKKAVEIGEDLDEHYATEANFILGELAMKAGNKDLARQYFEKCMDTDNDDTVYVEIIKVKSKQRLKKLS